MTKSELERLAILVEECAEVQQIAMKIIRHGYSSHNPFDDLATPNRDLLQKELGDLSFAMSLMIDNGDIDNDEISKHQMLKHEKIKPYLHFNNL